MLRFAENLTDAELANRRGDILNTLARGPGDMHQPF